LRWKALGLLGSAVIAAATAVLLMNTPANRSPQLHSHSLTDALACFLKVVVGWMGAPPLSEIWPWALVVVAVPGIYVLACALRDFARPPGLGTRAQAPLHTWLDLAIVLLSALMVAAAISYGRGQGWAHELAQTPTRYLVYSQPIAILLYLLLV